MLWGTAHRWLCSQGFLKSPRMHNVNISEDRVVLVPFIMKSDLYLTNVCFIISDDIVEMAKSKYSKFFVRKLLKYGYVPL